MRAYSRRRGVLMAGGARWLRCRPLGWRAAEGADVSCVDAFFAGTREDIIRLVGNPTST